MLEVWIDGACEPINPKGTASYGLVIKHNGIVLFREGKVIGKGEGYSNNVAEYSGLIAFLKWCENNGYLTHEDFEAQEYEKALIQSDSQLLINQMTHMWQVNKGMYVPYWNQASELISHLGIENKLFYRWIPREQNQEADDLSKQALIAVGIKPRH